MLAHVDLCAEIDHSPDNPAKEHAQSATKHPHRARFKEEKTADVLIARANRLHDANLASPLENRHHQRIHNPERGHRQRETAKDAEKQIHKGKDTAQRRCRVEQRERIHTHLLDLALDALNLCRLVHPHHQPAILLPRHRTGYGRALISHLHRL